MENQIKVATEIYIYYKGKLLLSKRGKNIVGAGTWALIGGHVEYKESAQMAAVRELQEEIGLVAEESRLTFKRVIDQYNREDDRHYIHVLFSLELTDEEIKMLANEVDGKYIFKDEVIHIEGDKCDGLELFELKEIENLETFKISHKRALDSEINNEGGAYLIDHNL